jgi:hypothetical protein
MGNSVVVFGFVWKCLEIFYLDGHNLGTIWFLQISLVTASLDAPNKAFIHTGDSARFYKKLWSYFSFERS